MTRSTSESPWTAFIKQHPDMWKELMIYLRRCASRVAIWYREPREEIEQAIFLKLWASMPPVNPDVGGSSNLQLSELKKRISDMTSQVTYEDIRKNRRCLSLCALESEPSGKGVNPLDEVIERESFENLKESVDRLPPEMKMVVELRVLGWSNIDIASHLDMPPWGVSRLLKRARAKLARDLERYHE